MGYIFLFKMDETNVLLIPIPTILGSWSLFMLQPFLRCSCVLLISHVHGCRLISRHHQGASYHQIVPVDVRIKLLKLSLDQYLAPMSQLK